MDFTKPADELAMRHCPEPGYYRQTIVLTAVLLGFCSFVAYLISLFDAGAIALLGFLPLVVFGPFMLTGVVKKSLRRPKFRATRKELIMSPFWRAKWSDIESITIGRKGILAGPHMRVGMRPGAAPKGRGWRFINTYDLKWWEFFDYIGTVAPHVRLLDSTTRDTARSQGPARKPTDTKSRVLEGFLTVVAVGGLTATVIAGASFVFALTNEPGTAECGGQKMTARHECVNLSTGEVTSYADNVVGERDPIIPGVIAIGSALVTVGAIVTDIRVRRRADEENTDLPPVTVYTPRTG